MGHSFLFVALSFTLFVGFTLLALSQDRHRRAVGVPVPLSRTSMRILRMAGYALVSLGLPVALWREGPSFGPLLWCLMISLAALAVTATIGWRPHWLKPLASIATRAEAKRLRQPPKRRDA